MASSFLLNSFLKNISQTADILTLTDVDNDAFSHELSGFTVKARQGAAVTEGNFVCQVDSLAEFLKVFHQQYHYVAGQEIYVTVLATKNCIRRQCDIESQLYAGGFHLDASEWQARRYEELDESAYYCTTTFRKVRQSGHKLTAMENLLIERDLHMDMLRECSGRSDAHVYRYVFAGELIRKNDNVLDCACGLGYGSYILSSFRHPAHVTGVDICQDSTAYANDVYGNEKLAYRQLDIDHFTDAGLGSYDVITSFETIEHVVDYHAFFKLCLAHLKPDGRVIASVPYMWVDETGKDPNPYHFHEFDWHKFKSLFTEYGFVIESRHHQTAPGGFKLPQSRRAWSECNVDAGESETEWLVVVATPDLTHDHWVNSVSLPYSNPEYDTADLPLYLNFQEGYGNPWLHRQLVQIGQRIENNTVRAGYAARLMASSDTDLLMLKTVEGYATDNPDKWSVQAKTLIDATCHTSFGNNPFTLRWYVSLTFLWARKQFEAGHYQIAEPCFETLTRVDCSQFCVLLNIKKVESHYFLARIAVIRGQREDAVKQLEAGKLVIVEAMQAFQNGLAKHEDDKATFLWPEMADMLDAGALLNNLLIKVRQSGNCKAILAEAQFLENHKRFGLINLVNDYKQSLKDDDTRQLKLIGQSYVNKLVAKIVAESAGGELYVWGTGIVAKGVCAKLQEKHIPVCGFIDNNAGPGQQFLGLPVEMPSASLFDSARYICITSVGSSAEIAATVPEGVKCIYIS